MMLAPSSSLLLASKSPKVCSLVLLDVSRENVWWMRWNDAESWLPKQINVLGTTSVKDSRWFGSWKMVKIEDYSRAASQGVRALYVGVRTDWTSGQILKGFLERILDNFLQWFVNDCFQVISAAYPQSFLHNFSPFSNPMSLPPPKVKDKETKHFLSSESLSLSTWVDVDGWTDCQSRHLMIDLHHPRWWLSGGCAATCGGGLMDNRRSSECTIKPSKMQHLSVDNHYTFIQPIYMKNKG